MTAVETQTTVFDRLSGPDPHPLLGELREQGPVHSLELPDGARIWLVTRYEEARRALADARLSKRMARGVTSGATAASPTSQHMLSSDPPDHTRLRRLVSAGFNARRIERLEPRITEIAEELLDAMAGRDEVDLIDAFAFPLPIQVICELLGVPADDQASFREWSNLIVEGSVSNLPGRAEQLRTTLGSLVGYIRALLVDKRNAPADDLLSALLTVRDEGDQLTEDELVSMVFLMLIAGHETTVNLIGNGVYLLLTHPEQRDRLAADPGLLPGAIEEFLRYEGPVQTSTYRITTEAVEYSGVEIPAGEPILISLMSANRDESQFPAADQLDVARRDAAHLAFGHGIHFCLGAALARLEGRIAIGALLNRYPRLNLAVPPGELDWRSGILIRGLARLPVDLTGGGPR
jgi:cytochrome P450